ncbi:hypothetical protein IJV79_01570 [bacterium]|nr:hypothetical protein [bacterium]
MKKSLVALFAIATLLGQSAFAACPCPKANPCDTPCEKVKPCDDPCEKPDKCDVNKLSNCENWLTQASLENYYCRLNLSQAQRCEATNAIEKFKSKTMTISSNGECESKCDCKRYRLALKELDCDMKNIITDCQKSEYKAVKSEVKDQVKCCHKCLVNPFTRCASCDTCD